jgi:hypothetical protein
MKQFKNLVAVFALATGLMFATSCKDECKNVECGTNGTCVDGICDCNAGHEGDNCEREVRAKFLGSYAFSENCTSGPDSYTVNVTPDGSDVTMIRIANIYDAGQTTTATVSGMSLTIASQTFASGTISGSGSISGNNVTLTYSITVGGASDSCTGTGTK